MSFSIAIQDKTTEDLNWQIAILRHYKEISDKHYRPVMMVDTARTNSMASSNIPRGATGEAAKTFGSKVSGTGYNLKGMIGWFDSDDPWYPNVLEYGSRSHAIGTGSKSRTRGQRERFLSKKESGSLGAGSRILVKGEWKTVAHVEGMAPRKFMAAAFDSMAPAVENDLVIATEAILGEVSRQ